MSFGDDTRSFTLLARKRLGAVFLAAAEEAHRSVVDGSVLTGAPGQPVDTGYLKNSWIFEPKTPETIEISTNVSYAPAVEDNARESYDPRGVDRPKSLDSSRGAGGATKSTVGGNHSVKLTVAAWPRVVTEMNAVQGGTR